MTQTLAKQCELHFLRSGIRILPYKLNTETPYHALSHAKVTVHRKAGELIQSNHQEAEPVIIKIDGTPQDRYYFRKDSVTIDGETAKLELWDALKILERGVVQEQFPSGTLGEIMAFIFDRKDDPSGVITGVSLENEASSQSTSDFLGDYKAETEEIDAKKDGIINDYGSGARRALSGAIESVVGFTRMETEKGGLYFKEVSPFQALVQTMEEFKFTPWVDTKGMLHFASPVAGTGNSVSMKFGREAYKLNEFNYSQPLEQPNLARIRGTYQNSEINIKGSGKLTSNLEGVNLIAEASYGQPGYTLNDDTLRDIHTLDGLENAAARALNDEFMQSNSGNFVINSAASMASQQIARLRAGDVLTVAGSMADCPHSDRIVDGGYMVHTVNHKCDQQVGWQTTVTISRFPPSAKTTSYVYDTRTNTRYDDLEEYKNDSAYKPGNPYPNPQAQRDDINRG